jgi:hypothetical protein
MAPTGQRKAQKIHPQPAFLKGRRGGIFRGWATNFLLTNIFALMSANPFSAVVKKKRCKIK